jgi:hypothetical protein
MYGKVLHPSPSAHNPVGNTSLPLIPWSVAVADHRENSAERLVADGQILARRAEGGGRTG